MSGSRNRLINAARRSMIQRGELQRKLGTARDALKPKALFNRGKYNVDARIDDAAHEVRQQFRANRLPIALAAVAGVVWILREPIKNHMPQATARLRGLVEAGLDKIRPGSHAETDETDIEETETPDEAPQ